MLDPQVAFDEAFLPSVHEIRQSCGEHAVGLCHRELVGCVHEGDRASLGWERVFGAVVLLGDETRQPDPVVVIEPFLESAVLPIQLRDVHELLTKFK